MRIVMAGSLAEPLARFNDWERRRAAARMDDAPGSAPSARVSSDRQLSFAPTRSLLPERWMIVNPAYQKIAIAIASAKLKADPRGPRARALDRSVTIGPSHHEGVGDVLATNNQLCMTGERQ